MKIKSAFGPLALSLVGILVAAEGLRIGENSAAELAAELSVVVGFGVDGVGCLRRIVVGLDQWEAENL